MTRTIANSILAVLAAVFSTAIAAQTDTRITYQGQLNENGSPVSDVCDFRFRLYNAASGGSQVGATMTKTNVNVTDGGFSVELDFGADAFDNSGRWLRVDVRCPAGSGSYTTLNPRQPITRAPYAIQTRGIFVDANSNVGIGNSGPLDELHVAGDNATLRLEDTTTPGGFTLIEDPQPTQLRISKHNPNGQVLFDLNPQPDDGTSNALVRFFRQTDTTGIKRVQFLRGDFTTSPSASIGVDGEDSYFQIHGGNVGFGTTSPSAKLHTIVGPGTDAAIFAEAMDGQNTNAAGEFINHSTGNASEFGVRAESRGGGGAGVSGKHVSSNGSGAGVRGETTSSSPFSYGVRCVGDFAATGTKNFVQPHPLDPSCEIHFVCLEGNESGTYFRGTARLENGRGYIEVPEEFRLATEPDGLTVQVTARGPDAGLWVRSVDLELIAVMGKGNVEFDYFVNGVRRGYADHVPIQKNHEYVPAIRGIPYGTQYPTGLRQILIENGILKSDFTPNEQTAEEMGWTLREPDARELSLLTKLPVKPK